VLKREIPKVVLEGYEPDPNIKAEPIQNGRNGKGRSQPRKQAGGRGKPAAKKSGDAWRKSGNSQGKSQHRQPRSGQGRKRA